ncbi:hypothetical protein BVX99_01540 [bacterium F16]|nr:hypothetical protein BVX99_01540 [bacterium F16]
MKLKIKILSVLLFLAIFGMASVTAGEDKGSEDDFVREGFIVLEISLDVPDLDPKLKFSARAIYIRNKSGSAFHPERTKQHPDWTFQNGQTIRVYIPKELKGGDFRILVEAEDESERKGRVSYLSNQFKVSDPITRHRITAVTYCKKIKDQDVRVIGFDGKPLINKKIRIFRKSNVKGLSVIDSGFLDRFLTYDYTLKSDTNGVVEVPVFANHTYVLEVISPQVLSASYTKRSSFLSPEELLKNETFEWKVDFGRIIRGRFVYADKPDTVIKNAEGVGLSTDPKRTKTDSGARGVGGSSIYT